MWSTDISACLEVLWRLSGLVSGSRRVRFLVFPWCFQVVALVSASLVVGSFRFPPYSVVRFVSVTVVTVPDRATC